MLHDPKPVRQPARGFRLARVLATAAVRSCLALACAVLLTVPDYEIGAKIFKAKLILINMHHRLVATS